MRGTIQVSQRSRFNNETTMHSGSDGVDDEDEGEDLLKDTKPLPGTSVVMSRRQSVMRRSRGMNGSLMFKTNSEYHIMPSDMHKMPSTHMGQSMREASGT